MICDRYIIHAVELTDRFTADCEAVDNLSKQISVSVGHITADGAYDKNTVYDTFIQHFKYAEIAIPPDSDAVFDKNNHSQRNANYQQIKTFGRMIWQKVREYGRRNKSETAIGRYKKILGNALRSRQMARQKNEAMLGCGILNKMTWLGMPTSYRCA